MFARVLIANRGEVVARIARTLRRLGCSPAAVHERDDPAHAALRGCDVTVEITSYLDVEEIVEAALRAQAQAIHPGYGFLSERAELARACEASGLCWIGPPAAAIELMGNKAAARRAATGVGVPVVPGMVEPTQESLVRFARAHGLPLMLKAQAGGGGRGMRVVRSLEEVEPALEGARREALAAFGDGALLAERLIAPARHLEVQVLADAHGTIVDLGERECSLQRRHQKVVEESPSPVVDSALRERLAREAIALAGACGYVGAGTVEFVARADAAADHYFLEMNTRLQVEHPVSEAVHGLDLVEWQLRIAAGERIDLPLDSLVGGHAVEARVYAEDPAHGFLPATGTVRGLRLPRGPGIRVDAGVALGEAVGTRYDPMLAKVVAHGATRSQALSRLQVALRDTIVLGVRTNVGFLCDLLDDERVREGAIDTGLVEAFAVDSDPRSAGRAALVALVAQHLLERDAAADVFARLGAWRLGAPAPRVRHLFVVDGEHDVEVALGSLAGLAQTDAVVDGVPLAVAVEADRHGGDGRRLRVAFDGVAETFVVARDGERWWVGAGGHTWLVAPSARERGEDGAAESDLRAPMPGQIVAVHTSEGAAVARGDVVVVMESMKMELQITAPRDGTVVALNVAPGDQVALDTVLALLAPRRPERVAA
jgi:acetyl-CoA/propionyl-CoA carboxylase biotin carboxyl carrier protein